MKENDLEVTPESASFCRYFYLSKIENWFRLANTTIKILNITNKYMPT